MFRRLSYRLVTAHAVLPLPADPDAFYDALDALGDDLATILPVADGGHHLRLRADPAGRLTVEWRDPRRLLAAPVRRVTNADLLAVHQAVLRCLRSPGPWTPLLAPLQDTYDHPGRIADYARTGLSIATALRDRARRAGTGPLLWAGRHVVTTDSWHDVPARGTLTLRLRQAAPGPRQGVAFAVPGGLLTCGPATSGPELILWPAPRQPELTVAYLAPERLLRVTNVYEVAAGDHTLIDRCSENAAMHVTTAGPGRRIYRCNHAATSPPSFADLVFTLTVSPAEAAV